ncbi:reverse transcriptase domain-containing protein [Tanacetum coccineum]
MRTRNSYFPNNSNVTIPRRHNRNRAPNIVEPELRTIVAPMAERTMEELHRAPTEGYGEAIILPEINADHFEIKTNLLQLVQANPFHGLENENPHAHINSFKRITSTLRFRNVPNDVIKLMMFPYLLEGAAKTWYEKEPPNSIWRGIDLRKCLELRLHLDGFTELTLVDTFYNGFKRQDPRLLNAAAGGNLLRFQNNHAPNFQNQGFQNQPFQVPNNQVQQEISNDFSSYKRNNDQMMRNMQNQINSLKGDLKNEIQNTIKSQQAVMMNQQTTFQNNLQNMLGGLFQNQASTSGTLPSNTIPNPKGEMKAVTTRSGVAYEGPSIPTNPSPKKVVERETEETKDKEQTNLQGSTAQIPPPVIPISIPKPDVPKSLPKITPIPKSDVPKSLLKSNIPYPSRRDDQKFAPTIKSLLMNKEKLLELAKIPLNENCSAILLKKLPEKLGDPNKFLIPSNFPGMDVCHALADLGASLNLMPLSIWKKLSLPELTPTRMTLELADRSITYPKGLTEDVFVKIRKFHFPTDFVVVDFKADPRVTLILGRSFLRTGRALIDVYEGELILRDKNEQIIFHVNSTTKKHVNESIKMVNDTCKDNFKKFTDEPALVCLPPSEDDNDEKEKQEERIFNSNKTPQVSSVFTITSTLQSIEPKDSFIMGDEHLSTFSAEEIIPILRESEDRSRSDSKNVLPSCDDFSSINVPCDNSVTFSNSLFEFDVNFNYSEINPLFDEVLEDIECKDSYDSNLDESTFLVTPLSDSNKDECFAPGDDIEILLHHDLPTPMKSVASILEGFIDDPPFEENDDLFDLECKTNDWKRILYDAPIDKTECFDPGGDNDEIDAFLAIEVPMYIEEGYYDSEGDVIYLESLLSDDTTHNLSPEVFFDLEPQHIKNEPDHDTLITPAPRISQE